MNRQICSYCGAVLRRGEEPTSHGCCQQCRDRIVSDTKRNWPIKDNGYWVEPDPPAKSLGYRVWISGTNATDSRRDSLIQSAEFVKLRLRVRWNEEGRGPRPFDVTRYAPTNREEPWDMLGAGVVFVLIGLLALLAMVAL